MTKIIGMKQKRPYRISLILNKLEQNGHIKSIDTANAKFYLVTEEKKDLMRI